MYSNPQASNLFAKFATVFGASLMDLRQTVGIDVADFCPPGDAGDVFVVVMAAATTGLRIGLCRTKAGGLEGSTSPSMLTRLTN